jgi:hypothetical protein
VAPDAPAKKAWPPKHWILAVSDRQDGGIATNRLHPWLDRHIWVLQDAMPARSEIRTGDWGSFYAERAEIVVTSTAAGKAIEPISQFEWPDRHPVDGSSYQRPTREIHWLPAPVPLPGRIRHQLELQKKQTS